MKEQAEQSEEEKLTQEKISLAKKLGIWESFNPIDGYETKKEFKRIEEIDKRLAEIING
ncbi:hypothetical protein [Paenibacillus sp. NRS-1760]|uniref:hypothetical protein n=1 Tax=Paenibacillus sp. NRS-1760 TaxID=3233902 RepID=UPI003D28170B